MQVIGQQSVVKHECDCFLRAAFSREHKWRNITPPQEASLAQEQPSHLGISPLISSATREVRLYYATCSNPSLCMLYPRIKVSGYQAALFHTSRTKTFQRVGRKRHPFKKKRDSSWSLVSDYEDLVMIGFFDVIPIHSVQEYREPIDALYLPFPLGCAQCRVE